MSRRKKESRRRVRRSRFSSLGDILTLNCDKKKVFRKERSLERFHELYSLTDVVLGNGGYSQVKKGVCRTTHRQVAVKIVQKNDISKRELQGIYRETEILKSLQHPNVVQLYGWFEDEDELYMVLEFIDGEELVEFVLRHPEGLSETILRQYLYTLVKTLQFCESKGIVHRDLKLQNVMLSSEETGSVLKLLDFNLGFQMDPDMLSFCILQTKCGTPTYLAPEILRGDSYDSKCDIWSFGVITYALASGGYLPFTPRQDSKDAQKEVLSLVRRGQWNFEPEEVWENISNELKDLIKGLLQKNVSKRLTYSEIIAHPFFSPLNTAKARKPSRADADTTANKPVKTRELKCATVILRAAHKFFAIMTESDKLAEAFVESIEGEQTKKVVSLCFKEEM